MEADTDNNTRVRVEPEPECKAHCTVCKYVTPKLAVDLAVEMMMKHKTDSHPPAAPPASPSYTTLTDSVKPPAVPSIAAKDTYGLLTKSLPEENRIKSSAEATCKPETRCSSAKPAAVQEAICTNSQVGFKINEVTALPELAKYATEADMLITSDDADSRPRRLPRKPGRRQRSTDTRSCCLSPPRMPPRWPSSSPVMIWTGRQRSLPRRPSRRQSSTDQRSCHPPRRCKRSSSPLRQTHRPTGSCPPSPCQMMTAPTTGSPGRAGGITSPGTPS